MTEGTNLRQLVGHKRTLTQTESDALQDMIRELITTERTYVKRLRILKEVCTRASEKPFSLINAPISDI